jgi:hypothetical protein
MLGRLIGAQRSTVTLTVTMLREEGLVRRSEGGRWLLRSDACSWPTTGIPSLPDTVTPACRDDGTRVLESQQTG